jgi:2-keto-3-deoxy-L-rhamnonate aldolase RhmA
MRRNKLRELLQAGKPTLGTHIHSSWPAIVEVAGHSGVFDYVEFVAEYAPFDLFSLDNFCRAVELFDMSAMIKVDQEPRAFLAQRAIGAGFQSILFADCRSVDDVRRCVQVVRPETPEDGGMHGVGLRRATYWGQAGSPAYVQALRDVVVVIMIEKGPAVEQIEEIVAVPGVDMVQWGPADYAMSVGRAGQRDAPEIRAAELKVIQAALKAGVPPRAEINDPAQAQYYLDLGVRHFCMGTDVRILYDWWKTNGEGLRKALATA